MWTSCSGPDMCTWFRIWYVDLVCAPRFSYPWEAFLPFWCLCFSSALPQLLRQRTDGCCEGRKGRKEEEEELPLLLFPGGTVLSLCCQNRRGRLSLFPCIHLHRIANHQILCKLLFWSLFEFCTSLLVFRRFGIDSFNLLQCLSIQIFWFWCFVIFFFVFGVSLKLCSSLVRFYS